MLFYYNKHQSYELVYINESNFKISYIIHTLHATPACGQTSISINSIT